MSAPSSLSVRLPKAWPRHVRSAVVHAVSMAHVAFTATQARSENHFSARARLRATNDRLQRQVALLVEELRIKDARMERLPAQRRPHYPPIERLAILELRAASGWSLAETARRLLVTPLTVASWTQRLDDEGPDALVQIREPVNRFPELVGYLVRRLRVLCPRMGSRRIARVFARAGLHLGATTVRRFLKPAPKPRPVSRRTAKPRVVTAKRPNHVWHLDLTTVPTIGGFWISWWPFAIPQRWPFCWWVAVVVDHFSRRCLGTATFKHEPSAREMATFLRRVGRAVGRLPSLSSRFAASRVYRADRVVCGVIEEVPALRVLNPESSSLDWIGRAEARKPGLIVRRGPLDSTGLTAKAHRASSGARP